MKTIKYFFDCYLHEQWSTDYDWPEPIQEFSRGEVDEIKNEFRREVELLLDKYPEEESFSVHIRSSLDTEFDPKHEELTWRTFFQNCLNYL